MARCMTQRTAPTHEIERQCRWKQGSGMVGHYTHGETDGTALRYLELFPFISRSGCSET